MALEFRVNNDFQGKEDMVPGSLFICMPSWVYPIKGIIPPAVAGLLSEPHLACYFPAIFARKRPFSFTLLKPNLYRYHDMISILQQEQSQR